MCEEKDLRENRLNLMKKVVNLWESLADLSQIVIEGRIGMEKEDLAYKVSDDFNIFVISDGTGKTATSVVHAALLQFDLPRVSIMDFAHVRSQEQICSILDMVEPQKDIVVYTVVDEELLHTLRAELLNRGLLALDLLGPLVEVLKKLVLVNLGEYPVFFVAWRSNLRN